MLEAGAGKWRSLANSEAWSPPAGDALRLETLERDHGDQIFILWRC